MKSNPDSDIQVLVRFADPEHPMDIGYHDGTQWRRAGDDAVFADQVIGWQTTDTVESQITWNEPA